MAAGLAAAGTGTATAANNPTLPLPHIGGLPDNIDTQAPLDTCQTFSDLGNGLDRAPCANAHLGLNSPNPTQKVGEGIVRAGKLTGALQDAQPQRSLGRAADISSPVDELAKTPTVNAGVQPRYPGVLDANRPDAGLVSAGVHPRGGNEEGVLGTNTVPDLHAMNGYSLQPKADPRGLAEPLTKPVQNLSGVSTGDVVPAPVRSAIGQTGDLLKG
jgi:hypothetical protein